MDLTFFMIKYIPFWCVPVSIIGLQFGLLYKLKGLNLVAFTFFFLAFICVFLIGFYVGFFIRKYSR